MRRSVRWCSTFSLESTRNHVICGPKMGSPDSPKYHIVQALALIPGIRQLQIPQIRKYEVLGPSGKDGFQPCNLQAKDGKVRLKPGRCMAERLQGTEIHIFTRTVDYIQNERTKEERKEERK